MLYLSPHSQKNALFFGLLGPAGVLAQTWRYFSLFWNVTLKIHPGICGADPYAAGILEMKNGPPTLWYFAKGRFLPIPVVFPYTNCYFQGLHCYTSGPCKFSCIFYHFTEVLRICRWFAYFFLIIFSFWLKLTYFFP